MPTQILDVQSVFDRNRVNMNQENDVFLMLTLKAPKIELKRQPLNLATAIDVSGSMQGKKIEEAKKSLKGLVKHLTEQDTLSIISFNANVKVIFGPKKMDKKAKQEAHLATEVLTALGNTNISGATHQAYQCLQEADVNNKTFSRVLLFTDGQPTAGIQDYAELISLVEQQKSGSLSAFGYGADHDPELLTGMARTGRGNFYYIENVDSAPRAFGRELGGLLSCFAQNIKTTIKPTSQVKILECLNPFDCSNKNSGEGDSEHKTVVTIPDMYSEEVQHLILKVKLPQKSTAVAARPVKVAEVSIAYLDVQSKGEKVLPLIKPRVRYVRPNDASSVQDELVMEQVGRLQAATAQQEAVRFARAGNYAQAQVYSANARTFLGSVSPHLRANMSRGLDVLDRELAVGSVSCSTSASMSSSASSYSSGRAASIDDEYIVQNYSNALIEDMGAAFMEDANAKCSSKPKKKVVSRPKNKK